MDQEHKRMVDLAMKTQRYPGKLGCRRCLGWGRKLVDGAVVPWVLCDLCNGSGDDPDQSVTNGEGVILT